MDMLKVALMDDLAPACLCQNCPEVPEEHCECCLTEAKNKKMCEKEGADCVMKVAKMALVWDKVT